jgi:fucose 4-O-acetylase-like acetyltransferase
MSSQILHSSNESFQRTIWVDYAKGIGIILVALGHTILGEWDIAGGQELAFARWISNWIYAFHMPLFFFLSGLFAKSLIARTLYSFLLNRWQTILYPYVLWSLIIHGVRSYFGVILTPFAAFTANFWRILYQPIGIFWFLHTLFLVSCLYYVASIQLSAKLNHRLGLPFALSVTLYGIYSTFPENLTWIPLRHSMGYFIYFCLGDIFQQTSQFSSLFVSEKMRRSFIFLGFLVISVSVSLDLWNPSLESPNIIVACTGIAAVIALSYELAEHSVLPILEMLGRFSLQIYVLHTAMSSVSVKIVQKITHSDSLLLATLVGTVSGLFVSLTIAQYCNKKGWNFVFSLRPNKDLSQRKIISMSE